MFDRQPVADSGRAKDGGVTAHRFYGADRPILVVDDWPDPESDRDLDVARAFEVTRKRKSVGLLGASRQAMTRRTFDRER